MKTTRSKIFHNPKKVVFSKNKHHTSSFLNLSLNYKRQNESLRQNNRDLAQQLSVMQLRMKTADDKISDLQRALNLQVPKVIAGNLIKMVGQLRSFLEILHQTINFCANPESVGVDTTILNPDLDLSSTPCRPETPISFQTKHPSKNKKANCDVFPMTPIEEQNSFNTSESLENGDGEPQPSSSRRSSKRTSSINSNEGSGDTNVTRRTKSKSRSTASTVDSDDVLTVEPTTDCFVPLEKLPLFDRDQELSKSPKINRECQVDDVDFNVGGVWEDLESEDRTDKLPVDMDLTGIEGSVFPNIDVLSAQLAGARVNLVSVDSPEFTDLEEKKREVQKQSLGKTTRMRKYDDIQTVWERTPQTSSTINKDKFKDLQKTTETSLRSPLTDRDRISKECNNIVDDETIILSPNTIRSLRQSLMRNRSPIVTIMENVLPVSQENADVQKTQERTKRISSSPLSASTLSQQKLSKNCDNYVDDETVVMSPNTIRSFSLLKQNNHSVPEKKSLLTFGQQKESQQKSQDMEEMFDLSQPSTSGLKRKRMTYVVEPENSSSISSDADSEYCPSEKQLIDKKWKTRAKRSSSSSSDDDTEYQAPKNRTTSKNGKARAKRGFENYRFFMNNSRKTNKRANRDTSKQRQKLSSKKTNDEKKSSPSVYDPSFTPPIKAKRTKSKTKPSPMKNNELSSSSSDGEVGNVQNAETLKRTKKTISKKSITRHYSPKKSKKLTSVSSESDGESSNHVEALKRPKRMSTKKDQIDQPNKENKEILSESDDSEVQISFRSQSLNASRRDDDVSEEKTDSLRTAKLNGAEQVRRSTRGGSQVNYFSESETSTGDDKSSVDSWKDEDFKEPKSKKNNVVKDNSECGNNSDKSISSTDTLVASDFERSKSPKMSPMRGPDRRVTFSKEPELIEPQRRTARRTFVKHSAMSEATTEVSKDPAGENNNLGVVDVDKPTRKNETATKVSSVRRTFVKGAATSEAETKDPADGGKHLGKVDVDKPVAKSRVSKVKHSESRRSVRKSARASLSKGTISYAEDSDSSLTDDINTVLHKEDYSDPSASISPATTKLDRNGKVGTQGAPLRSPGQGLPEGRPSVTGNSVTSKKGSGTQGKKAVSQNKTDEQSPTPRKSTRASRANSEEPHQSRLSTKMNGSDVLLIKKQNNISETRKVSEGKILPPRARRTNAPSYKEPSLHMKMRRDF